VEFLREQYLDTMTFRRAERPIFVELFGPLVGLEDEWRAQGVTEDEIDLTAFGFDYVRRHRVGVNTGMMGGFEDVVLEETDAHVIRRDHYGRRVKLIKGVSTIAHPLDFPVTDMDSWLRLKPNYQYSKARFVEGWVEAAPIGETAERVLDRVSKQVQVDQLSIHEDLAGKSGSLVGPKQIAEFMRPYYRRCWDVLSSRGAQIFQQDSDGNVDSVIDAFLDCGLTCMYPMEPAAGMDVVSVRKRYGKRLAMLGGIDKHVLRRSKAEIRAELEYKMQPMMREGGMIFGLDHRIPNGTPLDNYRYYVKTAREILGLDPDPPPGWQRMAF